MQLFTNALGTIQLFQDIGQNGRLAPAQTRSRFYRLAPF
jgi:hypothetical protein